MVSPGILWCLQVFYGVSRYFMVSPGICVPSVNEQICTPFCLLQTNKDLKNCPC